MNFFQFDHSFCEAKLWNGPPEYINSLTSIIISIIGIYGLINNHHNNYNIYLLYSSLIINGITSFFYHWNNQLGWGLLDRFSMILIAISSIYGGFIELSYLYKLNNNSKKIFALLSILYFTILLTVCGLGYEEIFNTLFGIFLALIIFSMYLINKKADIINSQIHKLIKNGIIGIILITIAGISWILIEKLCNTVSIMKYLQGHAIWHIFVSFGGYLISILLVGLNLDRKNILNQYYINEKFIKQIEIKFL
jgi:hypothetical protein